MSLSLLPLELRWNIWIEYCPELGPQPMVLSVVLDRGGDEIRPTRSLARTITRVRFLRFLLSLSRDSRGYAINALPNTIALNKGRGIVRYATARDIVKLCDDPLSRSSPDKWRQLPGFSDQVVNLCPTVRGDGTGLLLTFANLRRVFNLVQGLWSRPSRIAWVFSDVACSATFVPHDDMVIDWAATGGGSLQHLSWPDLPRCERWARGHYPRWGERLADRNYRDILERVDDGAGGVEIRKRPPAEGELAWLSGIWHWPMISLPGVVWRELRDFIAEFGVEALPADFRDGYMIGRGSALEKSSSDAALPGRPMMAAWH